MPEDNAIPTEHDEDLAEKLYDIARDAPEYERQHGLIPALDKLADRFSKANYPSYLSELYLQQLVKLANRDFGEVDAPAALPLVRDTTLRYPERAHLRGAVVEVRWRTGKWKSQGAHVFGKCKPTPKAYRECWTGEGPAPAFRLQLSLPYWILASDRARARLIHHELGHAGWKDDGDPTGRTHHIEEFADTIARFGLLEESAGQALVALAIAGHPETDIRTRPYQHRQQELFSPVWEKPTDDAAADAMGRATSPDNPATAH